LIRLFILQQAQPRSRLGFLDLAVLQTAGLLEPAETGQLRSQVDIRPYGSDDGSVTGWVVSDHAACLNTARSRPWPQQVLGVSPASLSLAQITPRQTVATALDLGTGCGVQSLHLAGLAERTIATDLNPRAVALAGLTFALSDVVVDRRLGSLYEPVAGQTFDLIVTNPPFVIAPPSRRRLIYRQASAVGDDLMRQVVSQAAGYLNPGGILSLIGNWAHQTDQDWTQRLRDWIPADCDALIIQRESLDPFEYVEIWLADAGWAGTGSYQRRYQDWLNYLKALAIDRIGLGWIMLQRNQRSDPAITILDWPQPVVQPVGGELLAYFQAIPWSRWSDNALLDQAWLLATDTVQESVQTPGASHPAQVWLRRQAGLGRSVVVDTALGGVLGSCDGELSLGRIIAAVATLTDQSAAALTAQLLPEIRRLIADGWLRPVGQ
jgi:methylase of polypeptide subunit release factors